MKIIDFKRKWVCILLILSVILQSCTVYKKKSITFDEAIAKNSKVKVTGIDGKSAVFNKIEKVDSVYYGLPETDGEADRAVIHESDYVKIQPKNKPVSTLSTVGVIVVPFIVVLGLLQLIEVH